MKGTESIIDGWHGSTEIIADDNYGFIDGWHGQLKHEDFGISKHEFLGVGVKV